MRLLALFSLFLLTLACSEQDADTAAPDDDTSTDGNGGSDGPPGTGDDAGASDSVCDEPVPVACEDALISDLAFHDDKVSEGGVSTVVDGEDFVSTVDATAGGYSEASENPWVYVRFGDDGLEKVEADDITALERMDWDLSLKRFLLRLNSGSGGPSCVGSATLLEASYDDLTAEPDGLVYLEEDFYTDDCTLINDSSGLPGSPQVALGAWWAYPGCVATTLHPHLIQTADGRVLKMVVEAYYEEGQEGCNEGGVAGNNSAVFTLRWRWLDS